MTDNMKLWNSVCETDLKHIKHVNQRGGYTAIDAQYQIQMATEQFGPFGKGWGVKDVKIKVVPEFAFIIYQGWLWYDGENNGFSIESSIIIQSGDRPDGDAVKKVATDALTKGLSKLGFNADVFLGKFDDNKYTSTPSAPKAKPKTDKYNHKTHIWFGKYEGSRWTEVNEHYLQWIVDNSYGDRAAIAQEELKLRQDNPKEENKSNGNTAKDATYPEELF